VCFISYFFFQKPFLFFYKKGFFMFLVKNTMGFLRFFVIAFFLVFLYLCSITIAIVIGGLLKSLEIE